ncbi:ribonuclease E/G [Antarcticimicrobium sediminis]|uniref:Ribonuclease G n=1 Tax=Antarcticimicrobium sediminis TaxID=2546227 RepID=A0A4R5ELJ0_9RHOB|nr:ribonuclease E/G [Antarcticimicrobium sediminis]TDE35561.1 ribonuclease G [Antarcticimicrobium sediminis]
MKGRQIVLDHIGGHEAAALLIDGQLEDLLIDSDAPRPGAIYRAIAGRPMKGQGGLFLDTPDGAAYLRQVRGIAPGQAMLVQVTGYAEPGKAIPVTTKLLFKSRYAIVTPQAPGVNLSRRIHDEEERIRILSAASTPAAEDSAHGIILRSACDGADADDIAEDVDAMLALADAVLADADGAAETLTEGDAPHLLAWRDWSEPAQVETDADGFERCGVLDALEALKSPRAPLPSGAFFYVEPTRALVAVDVNTGPDGSLAAGLKANIATARDLPRQLRLRGLGGQITIDLAPMPKKDRRGFEAALRAAFRTDSEETNLLGWTPLGHYELQRKRGRAPLHELLA